MKKLFNIILAIGIFTLIFSSVYYVLKDSASNANTSLEGFELLEREQKTKSTLVEAE